MNRRSFFGAILALLPVGATAALANKLDAGRGSITAADVDANFETIWISTEPETRFTRLDDGSVIVSEILWGQPD